MIVGREKVERGIRKHEVLGFIELLTDHDLAVLSWLASGKTVRWLAKEQGYALSTLYSLRARLYDNLSVVDYEVDSRSQVTKLYWQWHESLMR